MEDTIKNKFYKFTNEPLKVIEASLIEGNEIICEEVFPEEMEEFIKLGEVMIKFCVESGGLGLSAPQIGIMKKMFIWSNAYNQFQIIVNPCFFPTGKKTNVVEGCLSYPGNQYFIQRYKYGNASFNILDPNDKTKFKKSFRKLSGERAFVWQHELDHLNGITISIKGKLFEIGKND